MSDIPYTELREAHLQLAERGDRIAELERELADVRRALEAWTSGKRPDAIDREFERHVQGAEPDCCGDYLNCTRPCVERGKAFNHAPEATPSQGVSVPEGWKLVPVEPTEEMIEAAFPIREGGRMWRTTDLWRAMLDAAPAVLSQGTAPLTWPTDWKACPECHGFFSFNKPKEPCWRCPWCGHRPEGVKTPEMRKEP